MSRKTVFPLANLVYKLQCPSICLSVHVWKPHFPVDWKLLVEEHIAKIGIPLEVFKLLQFQ